MKDEFEVVTVSICDECEEMTQLNHLGLCRSCDDAAEAFASAAASAMKRGHNPFKAGMIAAREMERNKETQ